MTDDHAAAKAMYQDYLERAAVLERHRRYADDVVKATSGSGQTPVEPRCRRHAEDGIGMLRDDRVEGLAVDEGGC